MNLLLSLPLLVPLLTAIVALLLRRRPDVQRVAGLGGVVILLISVVVLFVVVWRDGIQVAQLGGWPAPFGVTLVADLFSAVMLVMTGLISLPVVLYSLGTVDRQRQALGYYVLFHLLLVGVCGAFLAGDLFNLFVWFEVMLIASFVLLALGSERIQLEGAIKYVTLNLFASAMFLTGVGVLYGIAGTVNMAGIARSLEGTDNPGLVSAAAMLFLVSFGIKAALFPFFFWLPASYHAPPLAVTALFAGLLTKVGVYALIRVFTLIFVEDIAYTHTVMLILAGLTMVTGVLGAVAQSEVRRLLSFHIVSQIGYLLMGLALYSTLSLAGAIFFLVHVSLAKAALFLVGGVMQRVGGSYDLGQLGGLLRRTPGIALLFLVPALSLVGMPPFSGFFAKLALVQAGLEAGQYAIVATALGVSVFTLLSMTKIWDQAFWKPAPSQLPGTLPNLTPRAPVPLSMLLVPAIILASCSVILGVAAEPMLRVSTEAAQQLLDPAEYIHLVLDGRG
jgi:multicomponent Na+:H+ antiporter subunit D